MSGYQAMTKLRNKLLAAIELATTTDDVDRLAKRLLEVDERMKRKRHPVTGQEGPPASKAGGLLD